MLTVGIDTFVTIDDADEYVAKHYASDDDKNIAWFDLSEEDKEVYLRNACEEMCRLHYMGVTFKAIQHLPFPRFFGDVYTMAYRDLIAPEAYIYPELQDIPDDVLSAQIEEALELNCPTADTEAFNARNGAVDSYTIGHLTEHFGGAQNGVEAVLKSSKAQALLSQYVGGSYDIK